MIDPGTAALAAAGINFIGGQMTNDANAARADASNVWSADQYARRYQTMTADLKAAGLNPMLAYSQSPGQAPTAQQVQFQNPASAATQGYQQVSQGTQSLASASQAEAQVKLIDATIDKTREEIKNIPEEGRRLKAAYINLAESSALMAQQGHTEAVKRQMLTATAQKMVTENLITRAQYDAMVQTGFIGVAAREVKVLSDVSSEWVDKLLPWQSLKSREREGALDRASRERSTTTNETGTTYDRHGNEIGGYSRSRSTK
jgi:hypothetical protein